MEELVDSPSITTLTMFRILSVTPQQQHEQQQQKNDTYHFRDSNIKDTSKSRLEEEATA